MKLREGSLTTLTQGQGGAGRLQVQRRHLQADVSPGRLLQVRASQHGGGQRYRHQHRD